MDGKILIINNSEDLRTYLKNELEALNFEVIEAKDGLDGYIKMRNQLPDLIIMDFFIDRMNGIDFLEKKIEFRGTKNIPVIIFYSIVNKKSIHKLRKYHIYKLMQKPIDLDLLFETISDLFKKDVAVSKYPSFIDVRLNDEILFIDISKGLNEEEIEIIKSKTNNIIKGREKEVNKVFINFDEIINQKNLYIILSNLLETIMESIKEIYGICILSKSNIINNFFTATGYKFIKIVNDFNIGIEFLLNLNKSDNEKSLNKMGMDDNIRIAIVDDDLFILEYLEKILSPYGWDIHTFENGKYFIEGLKKINPNLILLDLMMPEISGFEVLDYLNVLHNNIPVIIMSALADKNTILKVKDKNIKGYIAKPTKADLIIEKVKEVLKLRQNLLA